MFTGFLKQEESPKAVSGEITRVVLPWKQMAAVKDPIGMHPALNSSSLSTSIKTRESGEGLASMKEPEARSTVQ